jgi:hypothetical protein
MRDFTCHILHELLQVLKEHQYYFQPFAEFLTSPAQRAVILRHDVDARSFNALKTAEIEASLGLRGTYYFRILSSSYNPQVISKISSLGHEIGYHYEDLSVAKGNYEKALHLFKQNLAKLRRLAPVTTICMHGSPLSRFDNRRLWDKYNYCDFGIIGEPYFDLDFSKILYLTDTGRRWDGEKMSIRDKIMNNKHREIEEIGAADDAATNSTNKFIDNKKYRFHSTFDIIKAACENNLPEKIMITMHPQRWDNRLLPWFREYLMQNIKNLIKSALVRVNS